MPRILSPRAKAEELVRRQDAGENARHGTMPAWGGAYEGNDFGDRVDVPDVQRSVGATDDPPLSLAGRNGPVGRRRDQRVPALSRRTPDPGRSLLRRGAGADRPDTHRAG